MRKGLLLGLAGLLSLGTGFSAFADQTTYGAAGCGVGSIVFGDQEGYVQLFAATTNIIFFNQTFGITFGTFNCGTSALDSLGARVFIEANREVLAKDIARGTGETITNLSALAGCADESQVGAALQQDFLTIFPDQSVSTEEVSDAIMNTLSDPSLQCQGIG